MPISQSSYDALTEEEKGFYVQEGEDWKIDTEKIDPATNLKKALDAERELRRKAEKASKAASKKLDDIQAKNLEESENYKELWEAAKTKVETLESDNLNLRVGTVIDNVVNQLVKNDKSKKSTARLLLKNDVKLVEGEIAYTVPGVTSQEDLIKHYKENHKYLLDGNQSSGGDAQGGGGGSAKTKTLTQSEFEKLNAEEKMKFNLEGGKIEE